MDEVGVGWGLGGIQLTGQLMFDTYFFLEKKTYTLTFIIKASGIFDFNAFKFKYPYRCFRKKYLDNCN